MTTAADFDLWHDYARQLRAFFPFSRSKDGPQRIYSVPLTSLGISIGRSIDQNVVNHDLFRIGDLLLPADSPVFLPGPSYSQRLLRYLQAVEIVGLLIPIIGLDVLTSLKPPGKQDPLSRALLESATTQLAKETNNFLSKRREALDLYSSDPEKSTLSFDEWTKRFYPPYEQAQQQKNAASQVASDASKAYYGSQTDGLWADKARVSKAFGETADPPFNMPTSTAQITFEDVIGNANNPPSIPSTSNGNTTPKGDIKFEPRYNTDAGFNFTAISWVKDAVNSHNSPFKIIFQSTRSSSQDSDTSDWSDVGFGSKQPLFTGESKVVPMMPLFTAKLPANKPSNSISHDVIVGIGNREKITATVTILATDAKVFAISPEESWNLANVAKQYPKLRPDASTDLYEPFVLVTHILLGYMVSVTIQTDKATFSEINDGLREAKTDGGRCTLFGLDVGPISNQSTVGFEQLSTDSSTQTITIPPRDSATLTILGIMGEKLATPERKVDS